MDSTGIIFSIIVSISTLILGWWGKALSVKKEIKQDATEDAEVKFALQYIKSGVEDIRFEQRDQGRRFDTLSERVTRVEESTKQAHHRINRMEGRKEND